MVAGQLFAKGTSLKKFVPFYFYSSAGNLSENKMSG